MLLFVSAGWCPPLGSKFYAPGPSKYCAAECLVTPAKHSDLGPAKIAQSKKPQTAPSSKRHHTKLPSAVLLAISEFPLDRGPENALHPHRFLGSPLDPVMENTRVVTGFS